MEKLTIIEKQSINGGVGPMMIWVMITGACLVVNTIASLIPRSNNGSENYQSSGGSQEYKNTSNKGYIRVSPMMSSSSYYLPV